MAKIHIWSIFCSPALFNLLVRSCLHTMTLNSHVASWISACLDHNIKNSKTEMLFNSFIWKTVWSLHPLTAHNLNCAFPLTIKNWHVYMQIYLLQHQTHSYISPLDTQVPYHLETGLLYFHRSVSEHHLTSATDPKWSCMNCFHSFQFSHLIATRHPLALFRCQI